MADWQCADAPGGTFIILDHRDPKVGSPGTVLDSSHSYLVAMADRQGFIAIRGLPAAQMVRLTHWAKTDLNTATRLPLLYISGAHFANCLF